MANHVDQNQKPGRISGMNLFARIAGMTLLFGVLHFGAPLEDIGRQLRNMLHKSPASGDIVLVEINNESLDKMGGWPWPRQVHADLIDRASEMGAEEIYFDLIFSGRTSQADDRALAEAMKRAGNVTIAAMEARESGTISGELLPQELFDEAADIGSINAYFNFQTAVWKLNYYERVGEREIPTFATKLANARKARDESFPIDYSIDLATVPAYDAADLYNGNIDPSALRGKKVVIAIAALAEGDQVYIPGHGRLPGAYIQIYGAETLMAGTPISLGWIPATLLALLIIGYCCARPFRGRPALIPFIAIAAIVAVATCLEAMLVFADIVPALFGLTIFTGISIYRAARMKGFVNEISNLPNLAALRAESSHGKAPLVAARVHNYAEITSTLDSEGEAKLIDQIAARLSLGREKRSLFQGDEGIFAWFVEDDSVIAQQLEALHALFRSPVMIDRLPFDVTISFGVEIAAGRSLASRLGSALVAADEAHDSAMKWKYHDPAKLEETSWKLSLMSQLDRAIDDGEVTIALQPKIDIQTRDIVGAEALARWTHPEKGPISPLEFIAAAEAQDRVGKLTYHVLAASCAAASTLRRAIPGFKVAVNLSARMLGDPHLLGRVMAVLDAHDLPTDALMLELTETAALAGSGKDLATLREIQAAGIEISIDDYGTGLSTLEYLKKVPAAELKIDQSFIRSMRDNRSDLIMVQSTIALAHSLERRVVAEGVEDKRVLEQLEMMGCDMAQGFAIGRPMALRDFQRYLSKRSIARRTA